MRNGLQSLDCAFDAESLTHFGGMLLIPRCCRKLCVRRRLERVLQAAPGWADYLPADLILVLLYGLVAGRSRIRNPPILQYNGWSRALVGWAVAEFGINPNSEVER